MNKPLLLLASTLIACPVAWAEPARTTAPEAPVAPDSPVVADAVSAWKVSMSGGLAYVPRYEGASSNRVVFLPFVNAEKGHFFAGIMRGIGYNFSDERDLQYGLRMGLSHGRNASIDAHLYGMDDIRHSVEVSAFANARFAPCYLSASLAASSHGMHIDLGAGFEVPLSQADRVRIGTSLNWANTAYNQTFFGVSDAEATASGNVLSAYNANSGIKDYGLSANWTHSYSREWFSNAGLSYKKLAGSAKDSPLTTNDTMLSVNFAAGYRF